MIVLSVAPKRLDDQGRFITGRAIYGWIDSKEDCICLDPETGKYWHGFIEEVSFIDNTTVGYVRPKHNDALGGWTMNY